MEKANKSDFIDVYVFKTLNEIKTKVKEEIFLNPEKEEETDKKMSLLLNDLINANFKNLQQDSKGNLIYTFLPIVDERENKKVRLSLILYYTALYYDNVDLLHELLKEDINFERDYRITLQYLDKSISSKFDTKDYVNKIKVCGKIFVNFARSIRHLKEEEKEKYTERFVRIFNEKFDMINAKLSEKDPYGFNRRRFDDAFSKTTLDTFTDETYRIATAEQLELIAHCSDKTYKKETTNRLNRLMQSRGFNNYLCHYDLMMELFTDEELEKLTLDMSWAIEQFSKTAESTNKILEFLKIAPELSNRIQQVPYEIFMKLDNYTLIEICQKYNVFDMYESDFATLSKLIAPKVTLKRVFGAYKKRD